MSHTNKVWLLVITSAQRAKARQEAYLIERIPKLKTYEGFHHVTPLRENPTPETRILGHLEEVMEDDLRPENIRN